MGFRTAVTRNIATLGSAGRAPRAGTPPRLAMRWSVPVLRVEDVARTIAWYRTKLGFSAELFPERAPHEFAIVERDGVQLMVRRRAHVDHPEPRVGWDLYIWIEGGDVSRLHDELRGQAEIVRPLETLGARVAEFEVRDPDGYVLCLGGPIEEQSLHLTS